MIDEHDDQHDQCLHTMPYQVGRALLVKGSGTRVERALPNKHWRREGSALCEPDRHQVPERGKAAREIGKEL